MGVKYTPNYQIPYMDDLTPLSELDEVTKTIAEKLDAAMGRAGYTPPDATTFAALAARVTALEADTGWVPVPLPSGYDSHESFAVRKIGRRVTVRGGVGSRNITASNTFTLATLDAQFRPSYTVRGNPGTAGPAFLARAWVGTDGRFLLETGAGTVSSLYSYSTFTWLVD